MKDYLDLSVLLERENLDAEVFAQAGKSTFERRGMALPDAQPIGVSDEFAHDASRQSLRLAFLGTTGLPLETLPAIVDRLRADLATVLNRAAL